MGSKSWGGGGVVLQASPGLRPGILFTKTIWYVTLTWWARNGRLLNPNARHTIEMQYIIIFQFMHY